MPRQPRLQSPTDFYHVMMRGNNKEKIFINPSQKKFFLESIKELNKDRIIEIAAYCIMDNHVHLVVKADIEDLSSFLKKINTKYAVTYNYLHSRVGHVFQGRFKSEAIHDEAYLTNVIRYVHNNPVRAKVISDPRKYTWSSYNEYMKDIDIIGSNLKDLIIGCYGGINNFVEYHKVEDLNEYLDTNEEIDEYRIQKAKKIIEKYFNDNGIKKVEDIKNQPTHLEHIIKHLIFQSNLTNRQVAKLLNISYYKVANYRESINGDCPR